MTRNDIKPGHLRDPDMRGVVSPFTYLDLCIPSSKECDAQQNALLKDTVVFSADDEIDDQLGRSNAVQHTLDFGNIGAWLIRVLPWRGT